jgi:hypothetical protein
VFVAVWLGVLVPAFGHVAEIVALAVTGGRIAAGRMALQSSIGSAVAMAITHAGGWSSSAPASADVYIGTSFRTGELSELVCTDRAQRSPRGDDAGGAVVVERMGDVPALCESRLAVLEPTRGRSSNTTR